jgi:hypothetical protein
MFFWLYYMPFEYILLLIVSIFPIKYKLSYWSYFFSQWNQSMRSILKHSYHFWIFVEIPIFVMSFVVFFDQVFELFLYSIFFYFLLLYNVFVIGKTMRWYNYTFMSNKVSYLSIVLLFLSLAPLFILYTASVYFIISTLMLFIPIYFYVSQKFFVKSVVTQM